MKASIGRRDHTIRMIAGTVLLSLALFVDIAWRWLGVIGLMPFVTAIVCACPLYTTPGINTCDREINHV